MLTRAVTVFFATVASHSGSWSALLLQVLWSRVFCGVHDIFKLPGPIRLIPMVLRTKCVPVGCIINGNKRCTYSSEVQKWARIETAVFTFFVAEFIRSSIKKLEIYLKNTARYFGFTWCINRRKLIPITLKRYRPIQYYILKFNENSAMNNLK